MRSLRVLFLLPFFLACNGNGSVKDVEWMIGSWKGEDVNTLVFHEKWERGEKNSLRGFGCTISPDGDTLFHEILKIDLVDGVPYYYATLPKSKEPVLFKMIQGDAQHAIFENMDHDFPKRISYILETNNTLKVKLEGIEKGIPKIETLEFERNNDKPVTITNDTTVHDTVPVIEFK